VSDSNGAVQLAPCVASLFPPGIVAAQALGIVSAQLLLPEEHRCIETAVKKRQSEFAAGRACARRTLSTLGFVEAPLLVARDRMPIWPGGAIGSISHTDGYCVAVAGFSTSFSGIGVDTEIIGSVDPSLWRNVFRIEEIERLRSLNESQQMELATVIFSAKEAFYKCQFAQTRAWLGFDDVSVDTDGDTFRVRVHNSTSHAFYSQTTLQGKFAIGGTRVVCGIATLI